MLGFSSRLSFLVWQVAILDIMWFRELGNKVSKQTCMRFTQRLIAEARVYRCTICLSIPKVPPLFLFRSTAEVDFLIWMSEQRYCRYNTSCGKYVKWESPGIVHHAALCNVTLGA